MCGASIVAEWLRICLPMQETWVRSLGWADPLEKEMAAHPNMLAWKIPWTEEPGGLQSRVSWWLGYNWSNCTHMQSVFQGVCVGETVGVKALGTEEGIDGWPGGQSGEPCLEGRLGRAWKHAQAVWSGPGSTFGWEGKTEAVILK